MTITLLIRSYIRPHIAPLATALAFCFSPNLALAQRQAVHLVGSSTVFPFSALVAERVAELGAPAPVVEATGTGGGFKLFCSGVGLRTPDIANASRAVKISEKLLCSKNGVSFQEIKAGYDGVVLASSKLSNNPLSLSTKDIFLALAARIPNARGNLIPNPHKTWNNVNPSLPNSPIEVFGPPPTSGTRDAFVELAMEQGALSFPQLKTIRQNNKQNFTNIAHSLREDGRFIEAGENDNLIVQKLLANPNSVGIFGYSFLDQNLDRLRPVPVNNVPPDFDAVSSKRYPLARSLFFYVKLNHLQINPTITSYVREFVSENASGDFGYLAQRGLIPLTDSERRQEKPSIQKILNSQ